MKIVACGDSWCWGAELVDPDQEPFWMPNADNHHLHYIPVHEKYRLEHKYIQIFADRVHANEIIDLSQASISNDAIIRKLTEWLLVEGYTTGRDTGDLFVSIGWTSPERTEFYNKEYGGVDGAWLPFGSWSMNDNVYENNEVSKFMKLYFKYFLNAGGFIHRWLMQIWQTEMMLKKFNIKYVMFQAFYDDCYRGYSPYQWDDTVYTDNYIDKITPGDKILKQNFDPVRFMEWSPSKIGTSHNFMVNAAGGDAKKVIGSWHPNVLGHSIWGEHMSKYCLENKLL